MLVPKVAIFKAVSPSGSLCIFSSQKILAGSSQKSRNTAIAPVSTTHPKFSFQLITPTNPNRAIIQNGRPRLQSPSVPWSLLAQQHSALLRAQHHLAMHPHGRPPAPAVRSVRKRHRRARRMAVRGGGVQVCGWPGGVGVAEPVCVLL